MCWALHTEFAVLSADRRKARTCQGLEHRQAPQVTFLISAPIRPEDYEWHFFLLFGIPSIMYILGDTLRVKLMA